MHSQTNEPCPGFPEHNYARTVESMIGSGSGVQHPAFAYELAGRGEFVLTTIAGESGQALVPSRPRVVLPDDSQGVLNCKAY